MPGKRRGGGTQRPIAGGPASYKRNSKKTRADLKGEKSRRHEEVEKCKPDPSNQSGILIKPHIGCKTNVGQKPIFGIAHGGRDPTKSKASKKGLTVQKEKGYDRKRGGSSQPRVHRMKSKTLKKKDKTRKKWVG